MKEELPRKLEDTNTEEIIQQTWDYVNSQGDIAKDQWAEIKIAEDGQIDLTTSNGGRYMAHPQNFSILLAGQFISEVFKVVPRVS